MKITNIIEQYKRDGINPIQKYEAVECFRKNWDLDANNFVDMLKRSLLKAGCLLDTRDFYPKATILYLASERPKQIQELFRQLFDESKELKNRIEVFFDEINTLCEFYGMKNFHNLSAISTYLFFKDPNKYSLFGEPKLQKLAKLLHLKDAPVMGSFERLSCYTKIREHIKKYLNGDSIVAEEVIDFAVHTLEGNYPLNMILHGPSGTGKTYQSILYSVAIVENRNIEELLKEDYTDIYERYLRYRDSGFIEFVTFHQSYDYEDFIEGIRPLVTEKNQVEYEIHSGIFKNFCLNEPEVINEQPCFKNSINVWKVNDSCIKGKYLTIDKNQKSVNRIKSGDIILVSSGERIITSIGVLEKKTIKWFAKNFQYDIVLMNKNRLLANYPICKTNLSTGKIEMLLLDVIKNASNNRVFIIDEINRGNISKIFGELITLIEPNRRLGEKEESSVKLAYSGMPFGIPKNIYLIGTMNTCDYSLSMLDTALRRRFSFIEIKPQYELLMDINIDGICIGKMLQIINERIHVLYDDEHLIGHSYFMPLIKNPSFELLVQIFEQNIFPLLQEYFYQDYEKLRLVLGDNHKKKELQFIQKESPNYEKLFGKTDFDFDEIEKYQVNQDAIYNRESYKQI